MKKIIKKKSRIPELVSQHIEDELKRVPVLEKLIQMK